MFGRFVLSFLFPILVMAAQKGTIIVDETYIYQDADFDSQIMATVQKGEVFDISENTKGPFYRIRLKDKKLGWISSVDIKPGKIKIPKQMDKPLQSYVDEEKQKNNFIGLRFQGPRFEFLNWREKTLGKVRHDQLNALGWSWTGMGTLIKGPFYLDSAVSLVWEAPDYYKNVTGVSASGFILKAYSALLTPKAYGENFLLLYGAGAGTTFSHFEAGVLESGTKRKYTLEDLQLGVVVPLGMTYRSGKKSYSAWYRFYWEKEIYSSITLGLSFQY